MIAWRSWLLPGLVLVTLLTVVALLLKTGDIQRDIGDRVDRALATDRQSWATADVSGRVVTVMGTAPNGVAQRLAVESAGRVWGVAMVVDGSGLIPLQSPYHWAAERVGGAIELTGFAPSNEARQAIATVTAMRLPAERVVNRLELARGQPPTFLALADFALQRLAELSEGRVSLTGPGLSIDGVAADEERFASAARALSTGLPPNAQIQDVRILPPRAAHFVWSATLGGKTLRLEGVIPSDAARRDITNAIRSALPDIAIDDKMTLASGAPDGFVSAAIFAIYQFVHFTEGRIAIDGPSLTIAAQAKSVDDYEGALREIEARAAPRPGRVAITEVNIVPASVDPYVWRAERTSKGVTLTGYVPSQQAHDEILEAAAKAMPEVPISDRMRIAEGDPKMDWIGALKFSLEQLALLGTGSVALTGQKYDIVGEALSTSTYSTLIDTLKRTLPASMELRRHAVSPAAISPFEFAAERAPGVLSFSGYVPTDETVKKIVGYARPKFGTSRIEMRLLLAGGAPQGFAEAVAAGLQAVSRLDGGRLELVDAKVTVSGVAVSEEARQSIESGLRAGLPEGFEAASDVTISPGGEPLSGADCQAALRTELERERIQFANGGTEILPDSYGLIDRIAAVARRCPAATIEVGGHTDSAGGTRKNQALSEGRAKAVLERLVEDGVRRERLTAVGYGQTRPIASNSTAAGRTQNRRIELSVVGQ